MRVFFQFATCVCLIILAGGTINYIHSRPNFGGGFLLIAAWAILFALIMATGAFDKPKKTRDAGAPSAERIVELERRLTDIQDIVIAIDEKLSHIERQPQPSKSETA